MWLSGYARTVEGTPFPYHSFDPDIRTALLVRANRERPAAAWETAPLPTDLEGETVRFVWAFAFDAHSGPVPFTLRVNGEPLLVFENREADYGPLRFRVVHHDRHGDPMGFAILELPAAGLPPGEPVRLRVDAEDRDRSTWYMTFEHEVAEEVRVLPHPRVRREEGPAVQWVELALTHLGEDGAAVVRVDGREAARGPVTFGRNALPVPLPAVEEPTPATLEVALPGREPREVSFTQRPVRRWTVHLVQHTHTDIGYTRPQAEILPEHLRFIDLALDLCDRTDRWPDEARFRWTCEASWPVREYLRTRPPEQVERLRKRVHEGRIELTGMMFNLSEIPDEPSLLALLEPVKELRAAGLPVRLAMQNDVNGLAWCLADYFPMVGIDAFVMGQHPHRALACFERPTAFWWESPSGSRVLGWRADHYMTGNEWGVHGTDLDSFGDGLFRHLRDLEEKGYPFDRIAIQYSGYLTDNAPPSLSGPETIRRWNETWEWPRLKSATASEFLDFVREEHGDDLPVFRAAWPDWWTDGFGSAALETAAARRTHADLIAVQGVAALAAGRGLGAPEGWAGDVARAYEALLFYDEHTMGAAESISDPASENSTVQWGEKAAFVWDAARRTRLLRESAFGWLAPALPRRKNPLVVVANTLGRRRSGLAEVRIDHRVVPPGGRFRLLDPEGREVPAQAVGSGADGTVWLLRVPEVPALGYVALELVPGEEPGPVRDDRRYEIEVDPETGTLRRLADRELGLDLVDPDAEWGFLAVIHERLGDRHQLERLTLTDFEREGLGDVRVEPGEDGPVFRSTVVTGRAPDPVRVEIREIRGEKRIQVVLTVLKAPVTDPEGLYLAFPFGIEGAEVSYDVPGGTVVPGRDQLPGSSSDWHTVQNFVRARGDRAEAVVSSGAAPLWQLGGLHLGRFAYTAEVERPHLYSWVMNNYWVTNFRASQEGEVRFTYDLTSGPPGKPWAAARFGWGCRVPLLTRVLPAAEEERGEAAGSLLEADLPENVLLVSARPSGDGRGVVLHLRELDGACAVRFVRL